MLPLPFHWTPKIKVEDKDPKVLRSSMKGIINSLLNETINCYSSLREIILHTRFIFIERDRTHLDCFMEGCE